MMFLHFFVLGCTVPIMSLYYRNYLGFTGTQAGLILSMGAIAAVVGPFLTGFVADRLLTAEHLFAFNHFLGSFLLIAVYFSRDFPSVFILSVLYLLFVGPCTNLTNTITFHHIPGDKKMYGGIRVWGTIGWIAVAWLFSFFWLRDTAGRPLPGRLSHALPLSAAGSFLLSLFVFFSLNKPASGRPRRRRFFPAASLQVIRRPEILFIALSFFLISLADKFYFFGAAPYFKDRGISEAMLLPLLSIGQIPEIFAMAFLGRMISRHGFFPIIAGGILLETFRFIMFSLVLPVGIVLPAVAVHGLVYTFFFSVSYVFLDRHCDAESRAGVHQFFGMVNAGAGSLLGNVLAGVLHDAFRTDGAVDWTLYWLVPGAISLLAFLLFILKRPLMERSR